jgi:hypothetical protein
MEILRRLGNLNPVVGSQLSRSSRPQGRRRTKPVLDAPGSPDARDVLVRWERELGSKASQSPPVTPRKWVTPEAGGPTLWEGAVEGGIRDWGEVVIELRPSPVTASEKLGLLLGIPVYPVLPPIWG